MNIPCPNKANQCVCYGNPLANLSSEDPDSEIFLSLQFFVAPGNEPCQVLCESTVSQADADLCAQRQGKECVNNPDPITEPDGETPSRPPATLYCNKPIPCTDPPGSIIVGCSTLGINQADADAIAGSLDCGVYAITPPPVAVCPIITGYGQVSPLQLAVGDSVVLSVSYTYAGTRTLSFNWYMDGLPFAVTTGPTLDLPGLTIPDSGTYLLVIAAPGCSVASEGIVLTVAPPEFPYAYWTMDEAVNRLDSVDAADLVPVGGSEFQVAGVISNAVSFSGIGLGGSLSTNLEGTGTNLQYTGKGFSIAGWFRLDQFRNSDGGIIAWWAPSWGGNDNYVQLRLVGDGASTNRYIECAVVFENYLYANFPIQLTYLEGQIPVGFWMFFALTYDGTLGTFKFSLNDGAVNNGTSSYVWPAISNTNLIGLGLIGLGGIGQLRISVDEMGIYPFPLAANQITYLYNGGTGQTWPITLPDPI